MILILSKYTLMKKLMKRKTYYAEHVHNQQMIKLRSIYLNQIII